MVGIITLFCKNYNNKLKMASQKPNWYNEFRCAMHDNKLDLIKYILSSGEVNIVTAIEDYRYSFTSYLHLAQSLDVARVLLHYGARANAHNEIGRTPLHAVIEGKKSTELITELIRNRAEVDRQDLDGWTPLAIALYYENEAAIVELIRNGADPHLILCTKTYFPNSCFSLALELWDSKNYSSKAILMGTMLKDLNLGSIAYSKCVAAIDVNNTGLRTFHSNCLIEIEKMKSFKINDMLNVYNFLLKFNKHMLLYGIFHKKRLLRDIYKCFDIFGVTIVARIKFCTKRANSILKVKSLKMSSMSISGKEIILNPDTNVKICEYLSFADLKDLLEAYRR